MKNNIVEAIIALIIGIAIVSSVPALALFFTNLIGAIVATILLGIFVAVVIFVAWLLFEHYS